MRRGCRRGHRHRGMSRVDSAAPAAQVIAGCRRAGRLAARGLVLAAGCAGLLALFWLVSGSSAHAATASRAVAAPSGSAAVAPAVTPATGVLVPLAQALGPLAQALAPSVAVLNPLITPLSPVAGPFSPITDILVSISRPWP